MSSANMVSLQFVLFVTTIITSCVMYPTAIVDGQAMTALIATFLVFIDDHQYSDSIEDVKVDAADDLNSRINFCHKPTNLTVRWTPGGECPITKEEVNDSANVVCCTTCGNGFLQSAIVNMNVYGHKNCPICRVGNSYCRL